MMRNNLTSYCLMSALTPPRADLRGGNQSDDSLAISKSILTPFTPLRTIAADRQNREKQGVIG